MKIKLSVLLIVLIGWVNSYAQNQEKIDSLNKLLNTTTNDSLRALAISGIVGELLYTKPDSCVYYTGLGLDLIDSRSIRNRFEQSEDPGIYSFEATMYSFRAVAFSEKRNDLLAIRMALKARQLAENSNHKKEVTEATLNFLAEVYQNIGEAGIARDYLIKLLSIDTTKFGRQIWFANLGSCYYDLKNYDSALYYLNKVDPGLLLEENKPWPFPTLYLGHVYVKRGNYNKALLYYRTSIAYAEQDHYGFDLCRAYIGIGNAFKGLGITDSAILYANRCSEIATKLSLPAESLHANTFLANLYESLGKFDSAFKYQKISNALSDTIFNVDKIKELQNYEFNERLREKEIIEEQAAYKNKIRIYGLISGVCALLFFMLVLVRNGLQRQKAYALLQRQKQEIDTQKAIVEETLSDLKSTQSQLIQSEKMASLGELTAGIAHEIQNPLNFVNNFSEVNSELIRELKSEVVKGNMEEVTALADDIESNSERITHHGKRADVIVKGMLQHSRSSSGIKEPVDINALCDEYLRLCYHGLRARDNSFNSAIHIDFDETIGKINVIPQDIGRVILNLLTNAFYVVNERKNASASLAGHPYGPTVSVSTKKINGKVEIKVADNGNGIPQKVIDKIFQPFFTTKPTGQGTGLGLSLSYDIIKTHGGELKVETSNEEGTIFAIRLPLIA